MSPGAKDFAQGNGGERGGGESDQRQAAVQGRKKRNEQQTVKHRMEGGRVKEEKNGKKRKPTNPKNQKRVTGEDRGGRGVKGKNL